MASRIHCRYLQSHHARASTQAMGAIRTVCAYGIARIAANGGTQGNHWEKSTAAMETPGHLSDVVRHDVRAVQATASGNRITLGMVMR